MFVYRVFHFGAAVVLLVVVVVATTVVATVVSRNRGTVIYR